MQAQLLSRTVLVGILALAVNLAWADEFADAEANNRLEAAAKASIQRSGIMPKVIYKAVYPVGTTFQITAIHPSSPWKLPDFQGKILIATTCKDGVTGPGINLLTAGERKDWHEACFTKAGSTFEYYVYGFNFVLATAATPTPILVPIPLAPPSVPVITGSNYRSNTSLLTLPSIDVDGEEYSAILIHEGNNRFRLQSAIKK